MKKIGFTIIIFISFLHNVYAYQDITIDDFADIMTKQNYHVWSTSRGMIASAEDEDSVVTEEYVYKAFDTVDEAIEYVDSFHKNITSSYNTARVSDSYNVIEKNDSDYSYIAIDWTMETSSIHFYYYYFRYKNIVISGNSDFQNASRIQAVVNDLFSEKDDTLIQKNNTQVSSNHVPPISYLLKYLISFVAIFAFLGAIVTFSISKLEKKKRK